MNTDMTGFRWFFGKLCFLVLRTKVASALNGLRVDTSQNEAIRYSTGTNETLWYFNGTVEGT